MGDNCSVDLSDMDSEKGELLIRNYEKTGNIEWERGEQARGREGKNGRGGRAEPRAEREPVPRGTPTRHAHRPSAAFCLTPTRPSPVLVNGRGEGVARWLGMRTEPRNGSMFERATLEGRHWNMQPRMWDLTFQPIAPRKSGLPRPTGSIFRRWEPPRTPVGVRRRLVW